MAYSTLISEVKNGVIPKVDQIILDEFHRCGAPEWGRGVNTLLEQNQDAKVLGLSATPIRYLDKNRDMSDEIFDGNIVFQMDLTEAVARGILHFPFYINGIYKLDSDIKRYEKKINSLNDNTLKEELTKKLELAKRQLKHSTKLDELFYKYIRKKDSKNIIFCKDRKHMEQMIEEADKWFSKVNSEMDIYSVYYEKKNNEETLRAFYHSDNSHLKLLFCIDMLNEGFHDPNIDNIIMLRPTISPNLFIQQLGRGLSLGISNVIIFDIVNNARSGKNIRMFIEKVKRKRKLLQKKDKIERNSIENFEILDEVREVFNTLTDIEDMLQTYTSKEYKITLIEEFYRINNRLPKKNEKYKNISIGNFLVSIKMKKVKVTDGQLNRLLKLGFTMKKIDYENEKEYKIKLIEEFYKENERLPKKYEIYKEYKIGLFLYNIKRQNIKVDEEQLNRLFKIGFKMEKVDYEKGKEEKIKLLEEFYKEYRRLPKQKEKYKGIALGRFVDGIKNGTTSITEKQLERLQKLGFIISKKKYNKNKEEKLELLEEFHKKYGRLPYQSEKYKDVSIGEFLASLKRMQTSLNNKQIERLLLLGFKAEIRDVKLDKQLKKIEEFYSKNGRLPSPGEALHREKEKVGDILLSIKSGNIAITEEQLLRLKNIDASLTREDVTLVKHIYVKK